jgi:hypothetical protein
LNNSAIAVKRFVFEAEALMRGIPHGRNGQPGNIVSSIEKRAHLLDLKREHLTDQVFPQELVPPEKSKYHWSIVTFAATDHNFPRDVYQIRRTSRQESA